MLVNSITATQNINYINNTKKRNPDNQRIHVHKE